MRLVYSRKKLYFIILIVVVFIFSLSIVYAALSTVLEIDGSGQVLAANWNIYLDNIEVKEGSVTNNIPSIIDSSTIKFDVNLNIPGDYYEFTVDVINDGTIDAMIDSVIMTPELTSEQLKYFKYEVNYENGESISTKQLLKANNSTSIKIRLEYRNDISSSDLPTSITEFNLKLIFIYIQSDNNGVSVPYNGKIVDVVAGNIDTIGSEVAIGGEHFYIIEVTNDSVILLSKYNLYVGGEYYSSGDLILYDNPTGIQNTSMIGWDLSNYPFNGATAFSNDSYMGNSYNDYNGSLVELYVNNYRIYIESFDIFVIDARLITIDELVTLGCDSNKITCSGGPAWVTFTSYWTMSAIGNEMLWIVLNDKRLINFRSWSDARFGVRPVIEISKKYFE